jgi:uncharacterized SAM-binding protein YcdF (DUF218 family)
VPPRPIRSRSSFRRLFTIAAAAVLACSAFACSRLGAFLHAEDPLQHADAICVLAGTRMERPLEAVDLYLERWAPRIVLTEDAPDSGIIALERRGLRFPSEAEIARDTIVRLGVPAHAVTVVRDIHDSTAHEAHTFRSLAQSGGWRRIVIVTSKYHTRRAGFAIRRELKGSGVEVIVRASRYDPSDPEHWWRTRGGMRWTASETQKLIVYALGLGM